MNIKKLIRSLRKYILDLIFPKKCLNCKKEGIFFCEDCFSLIDINPFQYCLCDHPQKIITPGQCQKCAKKSLNGIYSATDFENSQVKKLIYNFKYQSQLKELAYPLSLLILMHLYLIKKYFPPNSLLVPIPLFLKKKKRRGFNQAEEIGKIISEKIKIPLIIDNLIRIKNTLPQAKLNKEQRQENIKNAFVVKNKKNFQGKIIFLLDDVYTTGATMQECAKILKKSGAREVWGLTVARELKM
ncbi:MAG: ComF family protein [Candidatus Paceibacterota bacterium]|jgi:ComF family protein